MRPRWRFTKGRWPMSLIYPFAVAVLAPIERDRATALLTKARASARFRQTPQMALPFRWPSRAILFPDSSEWPKTSCRTDAANSLGVTWSFTHMAMKLAPAQAIGLGVKFMTPYEMALLG
jgi:hypothetical protein